MGKIVLLVPREEMLYQAHNILQEKKYAVSDMRVIQTENAVVEARNAIAAGATILIARGLQASVIKQYTDIPVVEIVVTAQEMALLVVKAKQIVGKEMPVIAVVGVKNMFCDMSYFETIYDIRLRTYFASNGAGLKEQSRLAIEEGADLVIGGDVAVGTAKEAGCPSLFLSMTEDSLRTAFAMAENMDFAMGAEKRSNAQIETLLDYSFNGVVNMDKDGVITAVNPVMKDILGQDGEQVAGRRMEDVFKDIDHGRLTEVLEGRQESYSSFMQAGSTAVFAILAPVRVGDETEGAILTCHKVKRQRLAGERQNSVKDSQLKPPGLIARGCFQSVLQHSKAMEDCVHLARLYSQSELPVLILGETGTEQRLLAESMHNAGLYNDGAFFSLSLSGLSGTEQHSMIFGDKGAVFLAGQGTIYIEDVEQMSLSNQFILCQLIRYKTSSRDFARTVRFDVRIMASSTMDLEGLWNLAGAGRFRKDLLYLLSGLTLCIPPLRKRPEDMEFLADALLKECCDKYGRYHVLTRGALKCLMEYDWPGNRVQLEAYMNRLVLTAEKRSIDEIMVRSLHDRLYPEQSRIQEDSVPSGLSGPIRGEEERLIRQALARFNGNRERTADSLNISKATLWRKMKKYNIDSFETEMK